MRVKCASGKVVAKKYTRRVSKVLPKSRFRRILQGDQSLVAQVMQPRYWGMFWVTDRVKKSMLTHIRMTRNSVCSECATMASIQSWLRFFMHLFLMLVLVGNAQNQQEQQVCIKFMSSLGMKVARIRQHLLNVHGVLTYSLSTIHCWIRKFRVGGDVSYARRTGQPTKLTVVKIAQIRAIVR